VYYQIYANLDGQSLTFVVICGLMPVSTPGAHGNWMFQYKALLPSISRAGLREV